MSSSYVSAASLFPRSPFEKIPNSKGWPAFLIIGACAAHSSGSPLLRHAMLSHSCVITSFLRYQHCQAGQGLRRIEHEDRI